VLGPRLVLGGAFVGLLALAVPGAGSSRGSALARVLGLEPGRTTVHVRVVDAARCEPLPHRVSIVDADGTYFAPVGHATTLERDRRAFVDVDVDAYDGRRLWAKVPSGTFRIELPRGRTYRARLWHGLEWSHAEVALALPEDAEPEVDVEWTLTRTVDAAALGWMSADTHVHNVLPDPLFDEMAVEDVDYANLMLVGRRRLDLFSGAGRERDGRFVYVSQEPRDNDQGHLTLIGPALLVDEATVDEAGRSIGGRPSQPNLWLNWELAAGVRAAGGLAFHAHFLRWPGHGSVPSAVLGTLDGVEWLQPLVQDGDPPPADPAEPGFVRAGQHRTGAQRLYYDLLSCGYRLPLTGGTDRCTWNRVVGCTARTYVQVDEWSHAGLVRGLRAGRSFVTNGPLLFATVAGEPPGSTLRLRSPAEVVVTARVHTQRDRGFVDVVVSGRPVERRPWSRPGAHELRFVVGVEESAWIAVRAHGDGGEDDPWSWEQHAVGAHTSPFWVHVEDAPLVSAESLRMLIERLRATATWIEGARWFTPALLAGSPPR